MATKQQPSQRTFWIRRIVFLVIVVALICGLVALVSSAVGAVTNLFGHGKASASTSVRAGTTTNGASNGQAQYTTCMPAGLSIQAVVGDGAKPQSTFSATETPKFWFTLTDTGTKPCYLNVGTAVQKFRVTSGSELIWSNSDCKSATTNTRILLQPGVANNSSPIAWGRVRSSSSGCDAASGQSKAVGGGASYHLQVILGNVSSNDVQFILN